MKLNLRHWNQANLISSIDILLGNRNIHKKIWLFKHCNFQIWFDLFFICFSLIVDLLHSNRFLILRFRLNQMSLFRSIMEASLIWISPKQKTMLIHLFFLSIKIQQKKNGNPCYTWQESVLLLRIYNLLQVF